VTDLVDFLRARLDKDGQMARAASRHAAADTWRLFILKSHPSQWVIHDERGHRIIHISAATADRSGVAQHIARHDPARVQREIEAKRRIVELHGIVHRNISRKTVTMSTARFQSMVSVSPRTRTTGAARTYRRDRAPRSVCSPFGTPTTRTTERFGSRE
jgi:hypothetical protein